MNMRVLAALALGLSCAAASFAQDVTDDPLHGCIVGTNCSDNGTVTPVTSNPTPTFTFTASAGPLTGDLLIEVLIPNDVANAGSMNFTVDGTSAGANDNSNVSGTSSLEGDWTSGTLEAFLGLNASPTNPLSNWLGYTTGNNCGASQNQACDPGATGYDVYQVDLGSNELQKPGTGVKPVLTLDPNSIPVGSVITAYLSNGQDKKTGQTDYIATASSGGLFEADGPVSSVPEPSSIILFGTVVLGTTISMRKRFRSQA